MKVRSIRMFALSVMLFSFCVAGMVCPAYGEGPDGPPSPEHRERVRERIKTMRMWKLTEALDLDEKTAARLFPLLNQYHNRREETEMRIKEDVVSLKNALHERDRAGITALLGAVEEKHQSLERLRDEERQRLKEILTLEQQAQYLIFQIEFRRDMKRMIAEARGRRHKMRDRDFRGGR